MVLTNSMYFLSLFPSLPSHSHISLPNICHFRYSFLHHHYYSFSPFKPSPSPLFLILAFTIIASLNYHHSSLHHHHYSQLSPSLLLSFINLPFPNHHYTSLSPFLLSPSPLSHSHNSFPHLITTMSHFQHPSLFYCCYAFSTHTLPSPANDKGYSSNSCFHTKGRLYNPKWRCIHIFGQCPTGKHFYHITMGSRRTS